MSNSFDSRRVRSEGTEGRLSLYGTPGLVRGLGAGQAENKQRLARLVALSIEQAAALPFQDA